MGFFRRRNETLNEQLLREAGLDPVRALGDPQPEPVVQMPTFGKFALPDGSQVDPKEWDAATMAIVPGLAGNRVEFTTLPNGDVIVGTEDGYADLSPLADAVEQHLSPPYRAAAARQTGELWGIGAKRIEVAQIPFPHGERLELSRNGDDEELRVDGEPSDAAVPPALAHVGEAVAESFYVEAARIDGDLWDVKVSPL